MGQGDDYDFRCPECAQLIEVNASMREALIDHGCVVCGAELTESAFHRTDGGVGGVSSS